MSRGQEIAQWSHTATLLAMLINVNRSSEDSPVADPRDWNPTLKKRKAKIDLRVPVDALMHAFGATATTVIMPAAE